MPCPVSEWFWFPSLWGRSHYSPNYPSPAPPSPVITPVALPRSLQTLLLSKPLLLQPFLPFPSPTPAHQWLPFHEPPGYLPNDLLQTGEVARMKPRMVSLAGATALLLNSSDCLPFCLGVSCTAGVNRSYLTEMLYNYIVLLMLVLSDGFSKALLSFEFLQGPGLH